MQFQRLWYPTVPSFCDPLSGKTGGGFRWDFGWSLLLRQSHTRFFEFGFYSETPVSSPWGREWSLSFTESVVRQVSPVCSEVSQAELVFFQSYTEVPLFATRGGWYTAPVGWLFIWFYLESRPFCNPNGWRLRRPQLSRGSISTPISGIEEISPKVVDCCEATVAPLPLKKNLLHCSPLRCFFVCMATQVVSLFALSLKRVVFVLCSPGPWKLYGFAFVSGF